MPSERATRSFGLSLSEISLPYDWDLGDERDDNELQSDQRTGR